MTTIKYIQPKDIKRELTTLWEKNKGSNLTRASLFNLIIYVKKHCREEYLNKIARKVIRKFPSKLIFITEHEDSKEDFLRTYVSELKPEENGSSVFCEMIHFEVGGKHKEIIPFVLIPQFLPNLPIYLLWGDDPSKKDPLSIKLSSYATRTIFDSESSESISEFAKTILKFHEEFPSDFADLNWGRCAPWRELFTQTFNSKKHFSDLENAKEIRIIYNSDSRIQATYFQGWLCAKLKWKLDTISGTQKEPIFHYKGAKGSLSIILIPGENRKLDSGRILQIDLFSRNHTQVCFKRTKASIYKVSIERSSPSVCEMPAFFLLDKETSGQTLSHEIYNKGTNETFLNVLQSLSHIREEALLS